MFDKKVIKAFLDNQLKLYPEIVAQDEEEALDFLECSLATVVNSPKDVIDFLKSVGVDTAGLSRKELLALPEVIEVGDGRFLILEI